MKTMSTEVYENLFQHVLEHHKGSPIKLTEMIDQYFEAIRKYDKFFKINQLFRHN